MKTRFIQSFTDVISYALKNENMKKMSILLDICVTFQASSSDCKRGFGLMKSLETKSRNRLKVNHLHNLMGIKFNLLSRNTIDLDTVYNRWTTHKDRREILATDE